MKETERAASRRRWITLGEVVGILALIVSALGYWDSHQERSAPPKIAAPAPARAMPLVLAGAVDAGGDRIDLKPTVGGQAVQAQTVRFPTALGVAPVETTGTPRIEAGWFESGLRTALKGAKLHAGRHRLAVGIETTYTDGDTTRTDRAVYDLGYALHGRLLRPDAVAIEGVGLVAHSGGDLQAAVDARFAGQMPKP